MNIMLLSDIPPCKNFTAGIVLNILCDFLLEEGHNVCCFTVKDKSVDALIPQDKLTRMNFYNVEKPRENWGHSSFGAFASFIGNNANAIFTLPGVARMAGKFAKENNVNLIWSVVQGQTMIKLTEPVSKYSGVPYVIQVWDPPEWWLMENKFDEYTQKSVLKAFAHSLKNAKCCLAASWAMADDYAQKYQAKTIPVILGFSPEQVVAEKKQSYEEFVIAFSGQIYAENEFNALVQALNMLGWHWQGKEIKLRLYGRYFHLYFSDSSKIEIRGWLEQDELLAEIASADLLYCPYWFAENFQLPCKLSFPSKLSTYLKTGVPVLMHSPRYASPCKYIIEHGAGYVCDTLEPEGIKNILSVILKQSDDERAAVGEAGYQAFLQTLTIEHMKNSFFKSLGFVN